MHEILLKYFELLIFKKNINKYNYEKNRNIIRMEL